MRCRWISLLVLGALVFFLPETPAYAVDKCGQIFAEEASLGPRPAFNAEAIQILKLELEKGLEYLKIHIKNKNVAGVTIANRRVLEKALALFQNAGGEAEIVSRQGRECLLITGEGTSSLSKVAKKVSARFSHEVIYDPQGLIESNALGYANADTKILAVSTPSIVEGKVDQILLHEVRHVFLNWLRSNNTIQGNKETILTASFSAPRGNENNKGDLGIQGYENYYRLDELVTHVGDLIYNQRNYRQLRLKNQKDLKNIAALEKQIAESEAAINKLEERIAEITKSGFAALKNSFQRLWGQSPAKEEILKDLESLMQTKESLVTQVRELTNQLKALPESFITNPEDINHLTRILTMSSQLANLPTRATLEDFYYVQTDSAKNLPTYAIQQKDRRGNRWTLSLESINGQEYIQVSLWLPNLSFYQYAKNGFRSLSATPSYFTFSIVNKEAVNGFKTELEKIAQNPWFNNYAKEKRGVILNYKNNTSYIPQGFNKSIEMATDYLSSYNGIGSQLEGVLTDASKALRETKTDTYLKKISQAREVLWPFFHLKKMDRETFSEP